MGTATRAVGATELMSQEERWRGQREREEKTQQGSMLRVPFRAPSNADPAVGNWGEYLTWEVTTGNIKEAVGKTKQIIKESPKT